MKAGRLLTCLILLTLIMGLTMTQGCQSTPKPEKEYTESHTPKDPMMRVRLVRKTNEITVTGPQTLHMTFEDHSVAPQIVATPLNIKLTQAGWVVNNQPMSHLPLTPFRLISDDESPLSVAGREYPGFFRIVSKLNPDGHPDAFDLINHVNIEHYLPGVLAGELFPNWQAATFQAQAIAARSYALREAERRATTTHFDVESSTASQAYVGMTNNPRAIDAVKETAGLVLTFEGRIVKAFYSSTKGEIGQSPTDAFGIASIQPLQAYKHPPYAKASPRFQWDTIERDQAILTKRLVAWGHHAGHAIKHLKSINRIAATGMNQHGRPNLYSVMDNNGKIYTLRGERFRVACNFSASGLPPVPAAKKLPSSWFNPVVRNGKVAFTDGKGFGHGVGMCQYGAEGMARLGYDAIQILAEYYPGAGVERAY